MLHATFQHHQTSGLNTKTLNGFYHLLVCRSSYVTWSSYVTCNIFFNFYYAPSHRVSKNGFDELNGFGENLCKRLTSDGRRRMPIQYGYLVSLRLR